MVPGAVFRDEGGAGREHEGSPQLEVCLPHYSQNDIFECNWASAMKIWWLCAGFMSKTAYLCTKLRALQITLIDWLIDRPYDQRNFFRDCPSPFMTPAPKMVMLEPPLRGTFKILEIVPCSSKTWTSYNSLLHVHWTWLSAEESVF